jgi:hypothetical protein
MAWALQLTCELNGLQLLMQDPRFEDADEEESEE